MLALEECFNTKIALLGGDLQVYFMSLAVTSICPAHTQLVGNVPLIFAVLLVKTDFSFGLLFSKIRQFQRDKRFLGFSFT